MNYTPACLCVCVCVFSFIASEYIFEKLDLSLPNKSTYLDRDQTYQD